MEGIPKNERPQSLVEQKRQEAFASVLDALDARFAGGVGKTFEVHGRTYELTSPEDCMVAFAQMMHQEAHALYLEIKAKNDYREEQAVAKLLELFNTYERLIALYSELRSYYPEAAARIEMHVPSLSEISEHGKTLWEDIKDQQ
jgi:hypothetical protein